jgi:hypothetical protein
MLCRQEQQEFPEMCLPDFSDGKQEEPAPLFWSGGSENAIRVVSG